MVLPLQRMYKANLAVKSRKFYWLGPGFGPGLVVDFYFCLVFVFLKMLVFELLFCFYKLKKILSV